MIEPLEPRRLLAASAALADGVLSVTGTEGDDVIEALYYSTGPIVVVGDFADVDRLDFAAVQVFVNGESVAYFPYRDVERLEIDALAGDDLVSLVVLPSREVDYDAREITLLGGLVLPATVEGAAGNDTILGGAGADVLIGGNGNDVIVGGKGDDAISGGRGNDRLYGNNGQDVIEGGDGRDGMNPGAGFDRMSGGRGLDTVDYSDRRENAFISLGTPDLTPHDVPAFVSLPDGDALTGRAVFTRPVLRENLFFSGEKRDSIAGDVENALGGRGDDVILGNSADNYLDGGGGNDELWGGLGDDVLLGGAGDDVLYAYDNTGNGPLVGDPFRGTGIDTLFGGAGTDRAVRDRLDGAGDDVESDERLPGFGPS